MRCIGYLRFSQSARSCMTTRGDQHAYTTVFIAAD